MTSRSSAPYFYLSKTGICTLPNWVNLRLPALCKSHTFGMHPFPEANSNEKNIKQKYDRNT
jgi:hypothetical protein